MFNRIDISKQLNHSRKKSRGTDEQILAEVKRILNNDLFAENKILEHLGKYNQSFRFLDEEEVGSEFVYSELALKQVAVAHRLKFLESKFFKQDIPYEAILKIKSLNNQFKKELNEFRILAPHKTFLKKGEFEQSSLFVGTNHQNYYLIHSWGKELKWHRQLKYLPLRSFETLAGSIILFTLILTLSLPTEFITLDAKANYWCGYRAAAFFHLLIFNSGMTIYFTFAFALNFSSSIWNKLKDFG
ncbi:MAG: hypothetical protein PSX36_10990 [bacterium]|nr:hypothetical protein [bacterium]